MAASTPQQEPDSRLTDLQDLNGTFPFVPSATPEQWARRKAALHRQLLVANGLWPFPTERPAVAATVHGRVEREGYTVDRVFFESSPGLFVTGSLYRPAGITGDARRPAIACPHMHTPTDHGPVGCDGQPAQTWGGGRFSDCLEHIEQELQDGAEDFAVGGRHPLQARCVHLARNMGCIAFLYDMIGAAEVLPDEPRAPYLQPNDPTRTSYGDGSSLSHGLIHRFRTQRAEMSRPDRFGLFSAQAELRLLSALVSCLSCSSAAARLVRARVSVVLIGVATS